ncbi:asparaginase [Paenibacillus filicis]|uniref:Asparaginase n=1 Tax=Paenibacillus gyeongsangnamensis TaxID=3388067 RepID=A0ABT4QHH5_9BACL|nr:asparaginase [Paenibacillus filicis]MCZ8516309.1 asparaginase [Paenibacillus filicis]
MKHVHVFSLGGTISMTHDDKNTNTVVSTLNGEDLINGLPELQEKVKVSATSFMQVPSTQLTLDDILLLADRINNLEMETSGIVVTQGTDTIEETSFALDLLIHRHIPVVLTGAMRNPTLRGADGSANLLNSILLASSDEARGLGTVVVLNDEIHAARYVRKTHTQSLSAFQSNFGPIGWIAEGKPKVALRVNAYAGCPFGKMGPDVPVALLTVTMGDDGRLIRNIRELGYGGVIIEALGGGHVPTAMVNMLEELAKDMPVVIASRTGNGRILEQTYGYSGSETDLFGRGLLNAGWLDGRKSRILLQLLLRSGISYPEIKNLFHKFVNAL